MTDPASNEERRLAGLCADCVHSQKICSDRGSQFVLCKLSATDSRFAKYPRLPILQCPGYAPAPASP